MKLVLEYDGANFAGWQQQAKGRTVEAELKRALREMRSARVARKGAFVELELVAEGFLRGLVRSIAGALAEVGRGERPPEWVGKVLGARDRRQAPRTAPAGGLTLMEVVY